MGSSGTVRVGISGWRYPSWRGDFYPRGLPQRRELEYVARQLTSVELNGSFYSLQRPESYRRWRAEVPDGFVFAVKGGRFVTHYKRLRGVETPLANFFASGVLELGPALGPVLWQLPERLAFDAERLGAFLDLLPHHRCRRALAGKHDGRSRGPRRTTTAHAGRCGTPWRCAAAFADEAASRSSERTAWPRRRRHRRPLAPVRGDRRLRLRAPPRGPRSTAAATPPRRSTRWAGR